MGAKLLYLPTAEWLDVCAAHADLSGAHLAAVRVGNDTQAAVGVEEGEVVIIDVSREPSEGQYAGVETAAGFWLGYVSHQGGGVHVEPVCGCGGCRVEEFPSDAVVSWGPVVGICGRDGRGCRAANITKAGSRLRQLIW